MSLLSEVWDAPVEEVTVPVDNVIVPDMRGLMMDVLSNLPVRKVLVVEMGDDADQCSVCAETIKLGDEVRKLPCTHIFHKTCIDVWVLQHGTCPNCRTFVIPDDPFPPPKPRDNRQLLI